MADLSIFKLDSETITIKDTTAREAADSAKALATTASSNATTALNKINELESEKADKTLATTSANGLMSAADKKAIDREFFRMLPKGGTVIPNGANLNSTAYLKVGNYYQSMNVNTTNMTNIPIKAAFMMYVLSPVSTVYDNESTAKYVARLRIFIYYRGDIFVQFVYSEATAGSFIYGPWVKMTNSNDLDAALNKINELESEKADAIISSASGAITSFQDGAEAPVKSLTVGIEPVQEGTGEPSPDNVRPISGWTGAKVTRTGKNLFTAQPVYTTYDSTECLDLGCDFAFDNITISFTATNASYTIGGNAFIQFTTSDGKDAYKIPTEFKNESGTAFTANTTANGRYKATFSNMTFKTVRIIYNSEGYSRFTSDSLSDFQLELGSTATAYEPYQGETYDITFPTEAGTVYGGSLDVTTGVLTVDRAQIASYAGETLPSTWISDRDVYSAGATPTTGAQVVYELATPITYHLTPQEITTLLGQNNIWADTGDMSVTYRADTKLYIDKKFTELQALILEN